MHPSIKLLPVILLAPLSACGLIMHNPISGPGHSLIETDGPVTFSWSIEEGDPSTLTFELQNSVTLDSFEIATNVQASDGSLTKFLVDVPGSPWYRLQAVNVADVREVYATTDFFKVEGEILPTTRLWDGCQGIMTHLRAPPTRRRVFKWITGVIVAFAVVFHVVRRRRAIRRRRALAALQLPVTAVEEVQTYADQKN